MQPQFCTRCKSDIMGLNSDALDAHDASHYWLDMREQEAKAETENLARLEAIFRSHGYVESGVGVWVKA